MHALTLGLSLLPAQMDEAAVGIPPGMPIYDVQTDFPHHFQPRSKYADMLARVAEASPDMLRLLDTPDYPLPYPGARHILRWETTMVRWHSSRPFRRMPFRHASL